MDGADLTVLVRVGEQLFSVKLLMTSINCLWMYDYFLTLGDEINYAWSGRRSWTFVLFIANRYTPVLHFIWSHTTMFHYTKPFCQDTKWFGIFYTFTVNLFAQIAVALRVYAVTSMNRLLGGALALLITAQFCFGVFSVIRAMLHPVQPLPEIDLDVFKFCIFKRWRLGELVYYNLATFFDVLVFLIILVTARRQRVRHPGIPNLLDTIVQDATYYFMFIFFVQVLSQLFMFLAPEEIQLLPGIANSTFIPIMASRLMLSLKKAAAGPKGSWSSNTMTTTSTSRGRPTGGVTAGLALRVPVRLRDISPTSATLNEEDIELGGVPRLPRNRGSQQVR